MSKNPLAVVCALAFLAGGAGGVGRGVAGHTVRGVKKTGAANGKTFGKIGGVFHD